MKLVIIIFSLFFPSKSFASNNLQCFWVTFADKNSTVYSTQNPTAFLSPRAIQRRSVQNIAITENDFPVNVDYLNQIKKLGATIKFSSRWFNAVAIVCDGTTANKIQDLPFVTSINYVGKHFRKQKTLSKRKYSPRRVKPDFSHKYGYAKAQIELLNGVILHEAGLTGSGKMIAVLDAGFENVDHSPFFEHIRSNNQLQHAFDVIDADTYIFESSIHGTQVLSIMAANIPGTMVGTAPDATYVCIKTEDNRGEFRMDECNWIAGLEYADSLGVDVINSSLGYTTFDDYSMNYSIDDLDGNTALTSQAAEIAFSKGMIVVNSAGNEGNKKWKGLAIPADAPNVLAIGATNLNRKKCEFSSIGWVNKTSVKPDVSALGINVAIVSGEDNNVLSGKGTSYAAPLVSGLIAALWQAFPNATNKQILEAVRKTASDALHPNIETGFGIPNFSAAFNYLQIKQNK